MTKPPSIQSAKDLLTRAKAGAQARPVLIRIGLGVAICGALYTASKIRETSPREVANGKPQADFQNQRTFGSSIAAVDRERDTRLAKSARENAQTMNALEGKLGQIDKRLGALETGRSVQPTAPSGAVPASGGTAGAPTTGTSARPAASTAAGTAASPSPTANAPMERWPMGNPVAARFPVRPPMAFGAPTRGPATVSFPVKSEEPVSNGVVLPPGSYVRGKMLTGVAAPEGRPYPVLIELDYAHILPNRKRLDLSGCFAIAKAQGDLSTERLQMQATKLSCVGRDGHMFEREINGFVADDKDNNFAVAGEVVSKQDRVAVMAFLASIVEGVGKAVQQAQTTQQTTALGGSQTVLTGNQGKYLAAGGASDAGSMVAEWYLKEAQSLLPTINVNSGRDVWIVMQDSVNLPKDYFKQTNQKEAANDPYSYVTRLLE